MAWWNRKVDERVRELELRVSVYEDENRAAKRIRELETKLEQANNRIDVLEDANSFLADINSLNVQRLEEATRGINGGAINGVDAG